MKKNYILIAIVFGATSLNAQVGVNTETPQSTLHVKESEEFKSTLPEGIITPQFSGNDLKAKDNLYTELQKGTIVYITEGLTETASDKTINVNKPGYYFFDGVVWQKINIEPWKIQGTDTQASENNQNIYQEGNVAIGFKENDPTSKYKLDVKGTTKTEINSENENYVKINGDKGAVQYLGNLNYNFESYYSGNKIDFTNSANVFNNSLINGRFSTRNTLYYPTNNNPLKIIGKEERYDNRTNSNPDLYSGIYSSHLLINNSAAYTLSTDSGKFLHNGITMESNPDASNLKSVFTLTSRQDFENDNTISLSDTRGIVFQYSKPDDVSGIRTEGGYIFPKSMGSENQVLTTKGYDINDPNRKLPVQLEWKNISELTSPQTEPWKVQGSDIQASDNNQNIYQEGKVAIGQKLTDRVADTSLEVNGAISTIKTTNINNQKFTNSKLISQEFNDGNESVFIDGNFGYVGEPFDFTSSVSNFRNSVEEVILSPKGFIDYKVTGLTGNRLVSLNEVRIYDKTNSNQKIIFENDYGINLSNSNYRVATGVGEYSTGLKMISDVNNSGEFSNQFILGSYNISNKNEIKLGTTEENVTFKFSRKDSDDMYREESYVFPSNNGNKNQVLVTNGGSDNAVNNVATLEWKNIEDLVQDKIKLKSPGNKCFEITVSDEGQLSTVQVTCPQ